MSLVGTTAPSNSKEFGLGGERRFELAPLLCIFFLVAACKCAFYIAAPYPSFHFGDSGAYLTTALIKWIPPDRSFIYGFLLRPLVLSSHALGPVIAFRLLRQELPA